MYLPRTSCIICGGHIAKIRYNLKTTYSEKSNELLIKFVEKFYKNICFLHCNICPDCHGLLNELDAVQHREKELYKQLKNHISKLDDSKPKIEVKSEISDDDDDVPLSLALSVSPKQRSVISGCEEEIKIEDLDLKKLPITVKRISSKSNRQSIIEMLPKATEIGLKHLVENKKAFEQIQSSIQMDLSKHVEEHMNKSKPVKNILCEICGQNFKTKAGYENHLKKHDGIEDEMKLLALNKQDDNCWFCNICGKNFNQKNALARHMPIHTGETRYQCEECGKKFLHHSSFNMHRRIHAGLRNFECETCNHRFLTNSHLKRHIRSTHDKEKKYGCETCGKKFAENYNLVAHRKLVHKAATDVEELLEDKSGVFYQVEEDNNVVSINLECM